MFLCARTGCLAIAGYNTPGKGVPGSPSRTSTHSIPPWNLLCPFSRAIRLSFLLPLFFSSSSSKGRLHLRIVSDRSLTQIDRDGESKTSSKGLLQERLSLKHLEKIAASGIIPGFLTESSALLSGPTCYFMLIDSLYLRVRPLDAGRDRRIHILTCIMTTFTSGINERTSRRALRYRAAISPLKITRVRH